MKLLAVNVSTARQIQHQNKIVTTGIFKQTVASPVSVSNTGLADDEQADLINHGGEHKAVYAFSADHYQHWRDTLNRPELHYGQFGENLTISALNEHNICIGDIVQVDSVQLQVTQPRVPCYKLGIALADDKMPRMFVEQAETGIYFRVIRGGQIQQGAAVEIIQRDPDALSVKSLFRAYFDKTMPAPQRQATLNKAATITALSAEWREKVLSRLT